MQPVPSAGKHATSSTRGKDELVRSKGKHATGVKSRKTQVNKFIPNPSFLWNQLQGSANTKLKQADKIALVGQVNKAVPSDTPVHNKWPEMPIQFCNCTLLGRQTPG